LRDVKSYLYDEFRELECMPLITARRSPCWHSENSSGKK